VSTAMVPEPGKDLWLFCQCKGGQWSHYNKYKMGDISKGVANTL
jgi:hypothetical protein